MPTFYRNIYQDSTYGCYLGSGDYEDREEAEMASACRVEWGIRTIYRIRVKYRSGALTSHGPYCALEAVRLAVKRWWRLLSIRKTQR